jgi:cell division protein FtsL
MLKTYRIIPLVFILFLFGFTFIIESPVFAQGHGPGGPGGPGGMPGMHGGPNGPGGPEGRDKDPFTYGSDGSIRQSPDGKFHCVGFPEIRENPDEPRGVAYAKCKQKFNASPSPSQQVAPTPSVAPTTPSGGEVAQLNAKISGLEARLGEVAQLNAKISQQEAGLTGLQGVVRTLQEQSKNSMQQAAPTAPSGGEVAELNAKIAKLETQLSAANAAQKPLNAKISGLEARLGEVAQLNAKISQQEAGLTGLQGVVRTLQEQSKNSMQQAAPTAPSGVADNKKRIRSLESKIRSACFRANNLPGGTDRRPHKDPAAYTRNKIKYVLVSPFGPC